MTDGLPTRLKTDAILEAILEIRFEPDSSVVPEIIFGRFADVGEWREFKHARLPTADIPAPIRRADPAFRYQPAIEMASADGGISFRVGPQVIAYSRRGKYPGWGKFGPELETVIGHLDRMIPNVEISRLGLRYVNALKSDVHGIKSIDDMGIEISVADQRLSDSLNLNFKSNAGTDLETMSRIASVDLAQGNIPENATVIVDIDVYTSASFSGRGAQDIKKWVTQAHDQERQNFFKVLGKEATERLRED